MIQGLFYSKLILFQSIHKKFLDLLDEEAFLEKAVVELVYKFKEKTCCECLKKLVVC